MHSDSKLCLPGSWVFVPSASLDSPLGKTPQLTQAARVHQMWQGVPIISLPCLHLSLVSPTPTDLTSLNKRTEQLAREESDHGSEGFFSLENRVTPVP